MLIAEFSGKNQNKAMRLELLGRLSGYFNLSEIQTVDELKKQYYKLAKQYHPDGGGSKEEFQALSNEYEKLLHRLLSGAGLSNEERSNELALDENLRKAYFAIMHLPGIIVELAGKWLWVSGATYPIRKELKEAGFYFAPKKKLWYYKGVDSSGRGNYTIDEIRQKYGSQRLDTEGGANKFLHGMASSGKIVRAFRAVRRALDKRSTRAMQLLRFNDMKGLGRILLSVDTSFTPVLRTRTMTAIPLNNASVQIHEKPSPAPPQAKVSVPAESAGAGAKVKVDEKPVEKKKTFIEKVTDVVTDIADQLKVSTDPLPGGGGAPPQQTIDPPTEAVADESVNKTNEKKDNTLLYVGLGIGGTALLIGGALMFSGNKKSRGMGRVRSRRNPMRRKVVRRSRRKARR